MFHSLSMCIWSVYANLPILSVVIDLYDNYHDKFTAGNAKRTDLFATTS